MPQGQREGVTEGGKEEGKEKMKLELHFCFAHSKMLNPWSTDLSQLKGGILTLERLCLMQNQ